MGLNLDWIDLVVLGLATWRLSYMLVNEQGPFKVFNFVRYWFNFGGLLACIYCTSVWVALVLGAIHVFVTTYLSWLLAVSGLAMMLRSYTGAGLGDGQ
jgi:hypothetical protein